VDVRNCGSLAYCLEEAATVSKENCGIHLDCQFIGEDLLRPASTLEVSITVTLSFTKITTFLFSDISRVSAPIFPPNVPTSCFIKIGFRKLFAFARPSLIKNLLVILCKITWCHPDTSQLLANSYLLA
jgi:hypothetical protein